MKTCNFLLFDLGGVLIELGETPLPLKFLPAGTQLNLAEWFSMDTAHQFERGEISPEQFAETFITHLNLHLTVEDFLYNFRKWPKRVYPNVKKILTALSTKYHLSVLSNCNEIHWPLIRNEFKLLTYFDSCFSSHLIGLTKPDPSAFRYVLKELNTEPEDILFFDDNIENIRIAQDLGISAVQIKGGAELENYLTTNDMLS